MQKQQPAVAGVQKLMLACGSGGIPEAERRERYRSRSRDGSTAETVPARPEARVPPRARGSVAMSQTAKPSETAAGSSSSRSGALVVPTEWDPWALQRHYDKLAAERAAASAAAEPKQSAEPQPKQRCRKTKGTQTVKIPRRRQDKGTQTPTICTEPKKNAKKKLHNDVQTQTVPPPRGDGEPLDGLWHASELPFSVVASMGAGLRYESTPLRERTGMQVEKIRRPRL